MAIKADSLKQFETGPRGGKYVVTLAGLKRYVVGIEEQRSDTTERLKSAMASRSSSEKFEVDVPKGRAWLDTPPAGFKSGEEGGTRAMNYIGYKSESEPGVPSPERQKLQDEIRSSFLDKVKPADGKPRAILMMGGPASGKSSMVDSANIPKDAFVKIDADAIKGRLPEYNQAIGQNYRGAAYMAHEESSQIAKGIRASAIEQRKNILFDGTGANAVNYGKLVDELHGKGYHVTMMMMDLEPHEGASRAGDRAERNGRYVPPEEVKKIYASVPKSFAQLHDKADDFHMYENNGDKARPVWTKTGGMEVTHDAAYVEKFNKRAK